MLRVRGPAAPRGQSPLRAQARYALLPAPSPREGRFAPLRASYSSEIRLVYISSRGGGLRARRMFGVARSALRGGTGREGARSALARGAATGPGGPQAP